MSDDDVVEVTVNPPKGEGDPVTVNEEAPWGYKADGTPYKRDPSRYRTREARKGSTKRSGGSTAKRAKGPDYRNDVRGLLQMVGLPLVVAGQANTAFLADAMAIEQHSEPIAEAVNELALSDPRIAAALDKLAKVGPYGLLVAAVTPLVLQVATNHGAIPPGMLGTVAPDDMLSDLAGATQAYADQQSATV